MSDKTAQDQTAQDHEAAILARLVASDDDAEGMIAFALHRRAALAWMEAFQASEGRSPDSAAYASFMLGELTARRLADYRERASLLLSLPPDAVTVTATAAKADVAAMPNNPAARPKLRTWFWPWGFSTGFTVENPDQPINWKGLLARLFLLMLAVIVTALMLRVLVVRNL